MRRIGDGMFGQEKVDDAVEEKVSGSGDAESAAGRAILGILFFPALFVAIWFYVAGRWGRLRLSVLSGIALFIEFFALASWVLTSAHIQAWETLSDYSSISENWMNLVVPVILGALILGCPLGLFITWWEFRAMKTSPHRLRLEGDWMYDFKFRMTPTEWMKRQKLVQMLKTGESADVNKFPLGLDEDEPCSVVMQYTDEAKRHTLIAGNTGSGKSITLMQKIRSLIQLGVPIAIIDFKRDPELASRVAKWAAEAGGDFRHFVSGAEKEYDIQNSKGPCYYDALASGSPTSKADMVLNMRQYDTASAVYKEAMKQLLQVLFNMLENADRSKAPSVDWDAGGIYQLKSAANPVSLRELALACQGTPIFDDAQDLLESMKPRGSQLGHALEELQGQLRTITGSEYGRWMKNDNQHPERNIDLLAESQKKGSVVLFSLNSDSEKEFAQYVGSMIMSDLSATSAKRRNVQAKNRYAVLIDEFQVLPPATVDGLLQKARASKLEVTLALQSFEMIAASEDGNGEAHLKGMIDTCGSFIIHAGMSHDSAERLSKILGKHFITTYRATNDEKRFFLSFNWASKKDQKVQSSEEERWVFEPKKFMQLSSPDESNKFKSTAVYITKNSSDPKFKKAGPVARTVWMIPAEAVLEECYDPSYRMVDHLDEVEELREVSDNVEPALVDETPDPVAPVDGNFFHDEDFGNAVPINLSDFDDDDGGFVIERVEEAPSPTVSSSSNSIKPVYVEDEDNTALSLSSFFDEQDNGPMDFAELKKSLSKPAKVSKPDPKKRPAEKSSTGESVLKKVDESPLPVEDEIGLPLPDNPLPPLE